MVTYGAGHFYISQSDKGEMVMGGDLDGYNSYAQRGNLPTLQHVLTGGLALFPFLSRQKMLRTWGGVMDMSMDGSPIIDKTHIDGLYINCGWCYGGFKSTPVSGWTFAHTIAQDRVHELNSKLSLNRFTTGELLDEKIPILLAFFRSQEAATLDMNPVLKDVAAALGDKGKVVKIDVDKNQQLSEALRVKVLPTLMIYKFSEMVWRQSGEQDANTLIALMNEYIH